MAVRTQPLLLAALLTPLLGQALIAQKTPFKREVDGLIRFFRQSARPDKSLGDGSCRQTAMVLAAMGHSHRLYSINDGPAVRNPMQFVFRRRQADGSFADPGDASPAETTAWVLEAMRVLAPDEYATELTAGENWLKSRKANFQPFRAVPANAEAAARAARSVGRGPITKDGKPDMAANVQALLTMVRAQAKGRTPGERAPTASAWSKTQQEGADFLMTKQDDGKFFMMVPVGKDGQFMKHYDLGLTGMGIASLLTKPHGKRSPEEQKAIDSGLAWILSNQDKRGGFGRENVNYTTCAAVMALAKAGRPEFREALSKAQTFLRAMQNTEARGYAQGDRDYGSIGYGGDERGDLSNTQFAIQALRETGLAAGDEAFAKAIVFLQRTQNLPQSYAGKTRDEKSGAPVTVASGSDGGSAYYPGNSPAGYLELADGTKVPRSYGSMTYALLKTYTLCGMEKSDPRVQAAVRWIQRNFDLDVNPGADPKLGEKARYQGLFYYYMVMAQALDTMELATVELPATETAPARSVDWRKALAAKLASMQAPNGGWVNAKNGRWWEESDLVCTTYAMLALEHCR